MQLSYLLFAALSSLAYANPWGNSSTSSTSSTLSTSRSSSSSSASWSTSSSTTKIASSTISSSSLSQTASVTSKSASNSTSSSWPTYSHTRNHTSTGSPTHSHSANHTTWTQTLTKSKTHTFTSIATQSQQPTGAVTTTSTITKFIPCSTPIIGSEGQTLYYSTWLTATFIPTTWVVTPTGNSCPPQVTVTRTVHDTVTVYPSTSRVGHSGHHTKTKTASIGTESLSSSKYSASTGTKTGPKTTGTGSMYWPPRGTGEAEKWSELSSIKYRWPKPSAQN